MIVYDKELMAGSKVGCYPSIEGLYSIIAHDVRLHMERVGIYGAYFFRYLRRQHPELIESLGPEMDENVQDLFTLHDVGRAFVPIRFQNKAGGLTDEEFAQIKKHTVLAPDAMDSIYRPPYEMNVLVHLYNIAMYHHERWDGKGYPFGVAGEGIPLEARICSVVDSFDGMTSWKPYRNSMPIEKVKKIFGEEAGNQFQPELAEAFLECMDELPKNMDATWDASAGRYFS